MLLTKRQQRAASRLTQRQGRQAVSHPPQFVSTKRIASRARYIATGSSTSITRGMLLSHLIMNAAGTTTNYRLLSAFRLKSVECWASATALGSGATVAVEWTSSNGPSTLNTDTSMGSAEPAHVRTSPPPAALAGFWSLTGINESEVVFIITVPAGAVVDITYEAVFQTGEAATAVTTTSAGTAGQVFMTYLGGATTTTFQPVSYNNLT
jgi:hypothetical protein